MTPSSSSPHLQHGVGVQLSRGEGEQGLQDLLLSQGAVGVSRLLRGAEGEEEAAPDHQPLGERPCLVQGLPHPPHVIVQQAPVELGGGGWGGRVCVLERRFI